jgi:hypothetical protein
MKKTSFAKDFRVSLELLIPYIMLSAVIAAALGSEGSWALFFDKSLPKWMGLMAILWLVLGLYFTSLRRRGGVGATGGVDDDSDSIPNVNPATGLPMDGDFDIQGNAFGMGGGGAPDNFFDD